MKVLVLTVDQRDSRKGDDLVPSTINQLASQYPDGALRGFERTVGDEFQGILTNPITTVEIITDLLRTEQWSIGLGLGLTKMPLPDHSREATGSAFYYARDAVEAAKSQVVAVRGPESTFTITPTDLETIFLTISSLLTTRSAEGWEVVDLVRSGMSQRQIATQLDRTPQAISQRLRAARFDLEERLRNVAQHILTDLFDKVVP